MELKCELLSQLNGTKKMNGLKVSHAHFAWKLSMLSIMRPLLIDIIDNENLAFEPSLFSTCITYEVPWNIVIIESVFSNIFWFRDRFLKCSSAQIIASQTSPLLNQYYGRYLVFQLFLFHSWWRTLLDNIYYWFLNVLLIGIFE